MTVELAGTTLTHLTHIEVQEEARIVYHSVPGMSGDLAQMLGRPSVRVAFQGIFYGTDIATDLANLRSAYLENKPVDFYTESVGEGYFAEVHITKLIVSQRAGYLDQFGYQCVVVEYVEPPEPALADPFSALDDELLGEAIDFIDDVQNALEEVSGLADLITNIPSFGDPTSQLSGMLDLYRGLTGSGLETLDNIREIFWAN